MSQNMIIGQGASAHDNGSGNDDEDNANDNSRSETSSPPDDADGLDEDGVFDHEVGDEILSVPGFVLHLSLQPVSFHPQGGAKAIRVILQKKNEDESSSSSSEGSHDTEDSREESKCASRNTTIGCLDGYLLERPHESFFKLAGHISQELQELSVLFCNSIGTAERIKHEKLICYPSAVLGGGFLQIYKVEIHPEHQKQDLGLWMVHETMVYVRNYFTLAVMVPLPLSRHERLWGQNSVVADPYQTEETRNQCAQNELKVQTHFSRMGFHQAGDSRRLAMAFFLARDDYFQGNDGLCPSHVIKNWVRKHDAHKVLHLYVPPRKITPQGLDRQLALAMHCIKSTLELVRTIEDLSARGASIEKAKALHIASANTELGPPILRTLHRLGADINQEDEDGNTALHIAAGCLAAPAIETLLELGADASRINQEGFSPLQSLEAQERNRTRQHSPVLPLEDHEYSVKWHRCLLHLISPSMRRLLKDDWMSPRMQTLLLETAQILADLDHASIQMLMQNHLPASVLTRFRDGRQCLSLPDYFCIGVSICFEAAAALLRMQTPPTLQRVRNMVYSSSRGIDNFHRMLVANGRIEYVLDALFKAANEASMYETNGGCHWLVNYEVFQQHVLVQPPTPVDMSFGLGFWMCVAG